MRYHSRLAHRRRVWFAARCRWALALIFASALISAPASAQTLALPDSTPDYLRAGQSVIVRPIVRDVIGRLSSVARVIAVSSDTTVLSVNYASGGQRYTARAVGTAVVLWSWDRTDGRRLALADTVRVTAATVPPPVDTVPTPPAPLTVAALTITPATALQLVVGDSARLTLTGASVRGGISSALRAATAAELAAIELRWSVSGTSASVSEAGVVRAKSVGFTLITVCAGTVCATRGVSVSAPPVVVPPVDTVHGELIGSRPCRAFTATAFGRIEGDTAYFIRALPELPSVVYCVDDDLAIVEDGEILPPTPVDSTPATPGAVVTLLTVSPDTSIILTPNDRGRIAVTGGTIKVDGKLRAATLADLRAAPLTWTLSGAGLQPLDVAPDGLSATFAAVMPDFLPVRAIITVCVGQFDSGSVCTPKAVRMEPVGNSVVVPSGVPPER